MPLVARSIEELFPLIEFCKKGNLKAVSDWIAKGNPLDLPSGKKTRRASPLQIAIEKGFLTLTEVLLNGGADPAANGNAQRRRSTSRVSPKLPPQAQETALIN
jgi:hypothetical protein